MSCKPHANFLKHKGMSRPFRHISLILMVIFYVPGFAVAADETDTADSDGDGLTDIEEARHYKTDPQLVDTDTDGLGDGLEVNQHWTLPLVADTDGDKFIDGVEVRLGTDPTEASSHPTRKTPGFEDLDGDGIPNKEERLRGTDPQRVDSDFDGLSDFAEIRRYLTSPILVDTDGDGAWDGEEVAAGTDPMDAEKHPPVTK